LAFEVGEKIGNNKKELREVGIVISREELRLMNAGDVRAGMTVRFLPSVAL
jgi:hypothetical protein